jgi:hypothetical protein
MKKIGRKLADLEPLEGGGAGGSGGGGRSFSKGPQDIRRSAAEERAMLAKKEAEAARKKDEARVADEARYRADKAAGKIQSVFPIKKAAKNEYAKGGYVKAADGCAKKGKTKGTMR